MIGPGTRVGERYVVEELIGEGGIAQVWRATHVELDTTVALKVLMWRRKRLAERLLQEGRIQAKLRNPHVVTVTDVVRHDGQVALVMEYVSGMPLDAAIASRGGFGLDEGLQLAAQILAGVAAAHRLEILHRDLKPANILLDQHAGRVMAKVTDFGIAKVVRDASEKGTRTGAIMGTPGYIAPEQAIDASSVDARADVFSAAAIIYEMLAGVPAFPHSEGDISATSAGLKTPLSEILGGCPEGVCKSLQKALKPYPEARHATADAFAAALFAERPELLDIVRGRAQATGISMTGLNAADRGTARPTQATTTQVGIAAVVGGVLGASVVGAVALAAFLMLRGDPEPPDERAIAVEEPAADPSAAPEPEVAAAAPAEPPPVVAEAEPAAEPAVPQEPVPSEPVAKAAPAPAEVRPTRRAEPVRRPVSQRTAKPEPVQATPQPVATPAPVAIAEPPPPPPPAAEPEPEPEAEPQVVEVSFPTVSGPWMGTAQGRAMRLKLSQTDGRLRGQASLVAGTSTRTFAVVGTINESGQIRLSSDDEGLVFNASMQGNRLEGSYRRTGAKKGIPFKLTPE